MNAWNCIDTNIICFRVDEFVIEMHWSKPFNGLDFQQGCIKLIESDSKNTYKGYFHQRILENKMYHGFNIDNNQKCSLSIKSAS